MSWLTQWQKVKEYLNQAIAYLPEKYKKHARYEQYREYLLHNELELAMLSVEELLLEENLSQFEWWIWNHLRAAAEAMKLSGKVVEYKNVIISLASKFEKPAIATSAALRAKIDYISSDEKGRIAPVLSGYRSQFHYAGKDWSVSQILVDRSICFPGETAEVLLHFTMEEVHYGKFYPGRAFQIREGARVVGRGQVLEVLNGKFKIESEL